MSKVNPLYNEADITAYIQRVFYDVTPDLVSLLTVFHPLNLIPDMPGIIFRGKR